MVTLYTSPSCTSCRKAKAWLQENGIPFKERTEDIISKRSKAYSKLNVDLDELPMKQLYKLISKNPGLLRRPIIVDEKRLQVGYNEDEIRRFLPRQVRELELAEAERKANMI